MLDITVYKIAQIVLMARELGRAEGELRAFIDRRSTVGARPVGGGG